MSSVQIIARFSVHDGKIAEFKKIAQECKKIVGEKEDALQYDWHFSGDETECVVIETYRDSAAVFTHIANVGAQLEAFGAVADMKVELFGAVSDELKAAAAEMGLTVYKPFAGVA